MTEALVDDLSLLDFTPELPCDLWTSNDHRCTDPAGWLATIRYPQCRHRESVTLCTPHKTALLAPDVVMAGGCVACGSVLFPLIERIEPLR